MIESLVHWSGIGLHSRWEHGQHLSQCVHCVNVFSHTRSISSNVDAENMLGLLNNMEQAAVVPTFPTVVMKL